MTDRLGLERELVDASVLERTVERSKEAGVALPTFAQLADPGLIPDEVTAQLAFGRGGGGGLLARAALLRHDAVEE